MSKLFIFGNHPQISLAELESLYPKQTSGFFYLPNIYAIKGDFFDNISSQVLLNNLGGTVKIAKLIKKIEKFGYNEVFNIVKDELLKSSQGRDSKFIFGLSYYNFKKLDFKFGLSLKKDLSSQGVSCRLVVSKERELSSVVIGQNKVLQKGTEILIISNGQSLLIAKTEAVQDFKELSKRDYGRPARNDLSGMLPPKLARILVNLAGPINRDLVLMDPFCGSGTILTEAILAGYKKIIASDLMKEQVSDTVENINWIKERYQLENINLRLMNRSVINLDKVVKEKSVDIIVTEPYLGPQRNLKNIPLVVKELEELYSLALNRFYKILSDNGIVVMIWPVFYGKHFIEPEVHNWTYLRPRKELIYNRAGQRVWREIIILKKNV
jgi:tRNA G10  N-methylase Trm11